MGAPSEAPSGTQTRDRTARKLHDRQAKLLRLAVDVGHGHGDGRLLGPADVRAGAVSHDHGAAYLGGLRHAGNVAFCYLKARHWHEF
jgi:hypothetical protein